MLHQRVWRVIVFRASRVVVLSFGRGVMIVCILYAGGKLGTGTQDSTGWHSPKLRKYIGDYQNGFI